MRRLLTILCSGALIVAFAGFDGTAANAKPVPSVTRLLIDDESIDCLQATPAFLTVPASAKKVRQLRVGILRDRGVSASRAAGLLAAARRAYSPLKIRVVLARDEAVTLQGTSAHELIAQAKAHFGGRRPSGLDVVAVVTSANIVNASGGDIQGFADCIGGVAHAHRAFLVSEDTGLHGYPDGGLRIGPLTFYGEFPAKVLAHEIGHLMGAHHHHGNCVEGILTKLREVSPCTLMGPAADLISFNFSVVNGAIVRGHADRFLRP